MIIDIIALAVFAALFLYLMFHAIKDSREVRNKNKVDEQCFEKKMMEEIGKNKKYARERTNSVRNLCIF